MWHDWSKLTNHWKLMFTPETICNRDMKVHRNTFHPFPSTGKSYGKVVYGLSEIGFELTDSNQQCEAIEHNGAINCQDSGHDLHCPSPLHSLANEITRSNPISVNPDMALSQKLHQWGDVSCNFQLPFSHNPYMYVYVFISSAKKKLWVLYPPKMYALPAFIHIHGSAIELSVYLEPMD